MNFAEKYTNSKENDPKKIRLSDDFYAMGEMLEKLLEAIYRGGR